MLNDFCYFNVTTVCMLVFDLAEHLKNDENDDIRNENRSTTSFCA